MMDGEMASHPEFKTPQELEARIAELLVNGPIYKRFVYVGRDCHYSRRLGGNELVPPHDVRFAHLPQVKMYCGGDCKHETIWEAQSPAIYFRTEPFSHRQYVCRNCGSNNVNYWIIWEEDTNANVFIKVGQWPPLLIDPPPELAKALGPEDTDLYKRALVNGNFPFGMGALAYFRRVIENKVNMLLDLIGEAARLANFEPEEMSRIEEIKASHHVDAKIEYASKILPPHLRPGGHNPLNKLYGVASSGIHGKSDEDCLEAFQNARFEFEYLFKNLTVANEEAREFVKRVSSKPGTKS